MIGLLSTTHRPNVTSHFGNAVGSLHVNRIAISCDNQSDDCTVQSFRTTLYDSMKGLRLHRAIGSQSTISQRLTLLRVCNTTIRIGAKTQECVESRLRSPRHRRPFRSNDPACIRYTRFCAVEERVTSENSDNCTVQSSCFGYPPVSFCHQGRSQSAIQLALDQHNATGLNGPIGFHQLPATS